MLIDSHAHLYLPHFSDDIDEVLARAQNSGIERIYLPHIDSETTGALLNLEREHSSLCHAMMGLHPCSVKANFAKELQLVEDHLQSRPFAAIGEIGIDLYWDKSFVDQQIECFTTQCQWALKYDLPIVIHSRESVDLILDQLEALSLTGLRGIFHCFTGDVTQAQRIIDLGFLMGIGGVVTFKNSKLGDTLKHIDLAHLVLETDAPYLTPHPHRGKRNESSYILLIAGRLAEIYDCSVSDVGTTTGKNALTLFREYDITTNT